MASRKKTLSFEEALEELETLVEAMEDGDLSLEESLKTFEKGVNLTRQCQQSLQEAELKVEKLLADGDNIALTPFDEMEE